MSIFKRKSKEERKQERFDNFIKNTNLHELKEEDKEYAFDVNQELEDSQGSHMVRASEGEVAQLEMMSTLINQNWLMIKLLNEINNKLDK